MYIAKTIYTPKAAIRVEVSDEFNPKVTNETLIGFENRLLEMLESVMNLDPVEEE